MWIIENRLETAKALDIALDVALISHRQATRLVNGELAYELAVLT